MNAISSTPAGYTYFLVDERNNRPEFPGGMFFIEGSGHTFPEAKGPARPTLEVARAALKLKIETQLEQARLSLRGRERQLAEFDLRYAEALVPSETIARLRPQLVEALREYRLHGASVCVKLENFELILGYGKRKGLFVFSLPAPYQDIRLTFLDADIEALNGILTEAGFVEPSSSWNGADLYTYSVQVNPQQVAAS